MRPLLILGATGTLGAAFVRLCDARGIPHHELGRKQLDLASQFAIEAIIVETNAWAVVNAAGYVRVDDAEDDPETCAIINTSSPIRIAAACARDGLPLLTFSSDLVFDGQAMNKPYTEQSPVAPLNVYGRSKAEMERGVLAALPNALVIRTSGFFGPWEDTSFVTRALQTLERGDTQAFDPSFAAPFPVQQQAEFIVCLGQCRPQPGGFPIMLDSAGRRTQRP